MKKTGKWMALLAVLAGMFVMSAALLAILSVVMLHGHMTGNFAGGSVIAVYVTASLAGGFCMGCIRGKQKFLWGLLIGGSYFLLLYLTGQILYRQGAVWNLQVMSSCLICLVAGMLGGMLAPRRM